MAPTLETQLAAKITVESGYVLAEILDQRPGTIALFGELSDRQREQLADDAWAVGLRALANARAQAQEARLSDVGATLLSDLDRQLKAHVEEQHRTMSTILGKYFDPNEGQVTQRLQAFVDDEGILAHLLHRHLGPNNSVLAETLARQVGEHSELFKKLSLTESEGLVKVLERQLGEVMNRSHGDLVRALDPLVEDGAVARFLKSLREELKGADENRADQLAKALAALDANDEGSLISRLMRETANARRTMLHAVNPDAPDSPMASIRQTITATMSEQASSQRDFQKRQEERQEKLERSLRIHMCNPHR